MKILIAPDSFKDCLSGREVAENIKKGLIAILPDIHVSILPMADGGEGTVEALIDATGGRIVRVKVHDPLMRKIDSFLGITGDGVTAVIEMAAASGIQLVRDEEKDPLRTTTFGTGELIKAALDGGCRKILLGIGGSATNDCGGGMAAALGVRLLDSVGKDVGAGGGDLGRVETIDVSGLDPRIAETDIRVACDVTNPLTGPEGASHIYGPQKGADEKTVKILDGKLGYFAGLIREQLKLDVEHMPGAGAAGGLGAGLVAFLGARLVKGVEAVSEVVRLDEKIAEADLVITGEGKMDGQTRYGKTIFGVARAAKKYSKPVYAVAGIVGEGAEIMYEFGVTKIFSISETVIPLDESIANAPSLLESTGRRIAEIIRNIR